MENYYPDPINKPKEGIPLGLVVNKISKNLICPICCNLVWNYVDCKQCGGLFCGNCIAKSLIKVKNCCPMCRKSPFNSSDCKALKKLFINIQLKCPNKPCDEIILYPEYISHLEKCKFRKYYCSNIGCTYQNILKNKKEMEAHSKSCKYGLFLCSCGKKIKKVELEDHINTTCTQIVQCQFCHKTMTRGYLKRKHEKDDTEVQCLKKKVEYYMHQSSDYCDQLKKMESTSLDKIQKLKNEHKEELNEYQEKIDILEKKCDKLSEENEILNEEIFKWNNNFQNLHDKSFLNKKRKRNKKNYK